jgi:LacI family transcriptional regulator
MNSVEIARLAGVSRSTVSRVINNHANVQEETRRRVLEIIDQYEYEPNTSARALVGKPNRTVGLFIVGVNNTDTPNRIRNSGYFAAFMEIIVDAISTYGYYTMTIVLNTFDDYDKIRQAFLQGRIDCGIILGTQATEDVYGQMLNKGYPLVMIDIDPAECRKFRGGQTNLTVVNAMDYEGAYSVVEYLIGLGHTEIGLINGLMLTHSARERYRAFMDAMRNHKLPVREDYVLNCNFHPLRAVAEVNRLIERKTLPTAFFSSNDDMAMAVIKAFRSANIRVPRDISIVGFDDVFASSHSSPALTTMHVPMEEMARKAAEATIFAIEHKDRTQTFYNLPTKLVLRESCAPRIVK